VKENASTGKKQSVVNLRELFVFCALLVGIFLTRLYNYPLFHSLSEMFSILIALGLFLIAWNTRENIQNKGLLFLGIAYFFVALIDLVHTLAYKGMGVFPEFTSNLPTQLWIGARYLESISLLIAPIFIERPFKPHLIFLSYSLVVTLIFLSIFLFGIFPTCYVEGSGLTTFKIVSEYVISGILLLSMYLYFQKRAFFPGESLVLIEFSLIFTVFSEITFTQYVGVYGVANMIGHIFKVISFYLIYLAVISTGLRKPMDLLWRALKESEEKYRNLVEGMAEGVVILDSEEKFIYANPRAEEVFGITGGELEGRSLLEFIPPEELLKVEEQTRRRKKGLTDRYELEISGADGKRRIISVSVSPILDGQGNYKGASGVFEDITLKREKEKEVERLAAIVNSASETFLLFDSGGKILAWNKMAEEFFPSLKQDSGAKSYLDLIFKDNRDEAWEKFEEAIKGKGGIRFESQIKTEEGKSIPVLITLFPIPGATEKQVEIAALIVDIRERKKAEELHADFIRSLVHDLSNPLSASLTALEMIQTGKKDGSSLEEYLEILGMNVKRIANLLANFSRALNWPSNGINLEKNPRNLFEILSRLLEAQKPLFSRKGIELRFTSQGENVMVLANENLERAIGNILDNALKFTPEGGKVEVSLHKEGHKALISIADTGTGISSSDLPHIFERFYRGKGANTGTGLGLYTARLAVEELGGEIRAESELGKGSKFTISLPLKEG
jgi:PAS domain S-box-containing protein